MIALVPVSLIAQYGKADHSGFGFHCPPNFLRATNFLVDSYASNNQSDWCISCVTYIKQINWSKLIITDRTV